MISRAGQTPVPKFKEQSASRLPNVSKITDSSSVVKKHEVHHPYFNQIVK